MVTRFTCVVCLALGLCVAEARANMSLGFQISGQVGFELVGFGQPGGTQAVGNVLINNILPGSTVHFAAVYSDDFVPNGGGQSNITVTDPSLTPILTANNVSPTSQDPPSAPFNFGWEVPLNPVGLTSGLYGISFTPSVLVPPSTAQMHGAGMLVVYSHPTLPQSTITVMHGAEYLDGISPGSGHTSQTVSFPDQPGTPIGAGSGTLAILTLGDDAMDPPPNANETLDFNGSTVHTILDGNLDPISNTSSIVSVPVTTLAGNNANSATVHAGTDIFGWHVAVLQSPVPEPGALGLLVVGASAVGRRRK